MFLDPQQLDAQPGRGEPSCSPAAAAFVVAAYLPEVARIAVGTGNGAHLRELVDATALPVSTAQVARYRTLLDQHQQTRPLPAATDSAC